MWTEFAAVDGAAFLDVNVLEVGVSMVDSRIEDGDGCSVAGCDVVGSFNVGDVLVPRRSQYFG